MEKSGASLVPNKIARYLDKPSEEFTRADIIKYIKENNIEAVNFRHLGGDGRLKTLNFVITSPSQLEQLLSSGERVDGSSLFSYIDSSSSDLYIIPRYRTAFENPFSSVPALDILCSYYTKEGQRLGSSPENILKKAHDSLKRSTGFSFEAMGELEYYVIAPKQSLYMANSQRGYQESAPFCRWESLRYEAMQYIAQCGGKIKYGHSEVGHIYGEENEMEQNEIEFTPVNVEDAADQLVIAKWVLRMIGKRYGVNISFAPKILVGHAGSGLHFHTRIMKNGASAMVENGALSDVAKKAIAGYLTLAPSLTAFANTIPLSFLRLVPHQEAPTNICWGDRNRSVLVRVPLGWLGVNNMAQDANPLEKESAPDFGSNQTVEFRSPDGSANIHMILAGLCVAARHGLTMGNALDVASKLYVGVNIFAAENKELQESLPQLPDSCYSAADSLIRDRSFYEEGGVFPATVIDGMAKILKSYNDKDLSQRYYGNGAAIQKLVDEFLHHA
ncbi:MAG: glutamine synthetase family protein [Dehalococcoidales bacterium]|jgi:glutamine synthetase